MTDATLIAVLSAAISLLALVVSTATMYFAWLRHGNLAMTKPALVFFGFDAVPRQTAKIFVRTLLYSTSAKGQIVESMYAKVLYEEVEQNFSFWGHADREQISPGSGLFVQGRSLHNRDICKAGGTSRCQASDHSAHLGRPSRNFAARRRWSSVRTASRYAGVCRLNPRATREVGRPFNIKIELKLCEPSPQPSPARGRGRKSNNLLPAQTLSGRRGRSRPGWRAPRCCSRGPRRRAWRAWRAATPATSGRACRPSCG